MTADPPMSDLRAKIEELTDRLADESGGDYTYDPIDAGYYGALDDLRALVGLPPCDRSRREPVNPPDSEASE